MTQHTGRDEIWNHALRYALLEESFKLTRVEDDLEQGVSERTIRDTLNTMVDYGWLVKDAPQAHEWHPGPKALDIGEFEDKFNQSEGNPDDVGTYPGVEKTESAHSDRVSNSANLVVEGVGADHVLGTHGPIEEYVKIPFDADDNPIRVTPPRLYSPRVLVCRERAVVRGDSGVEIIKQPRLHVGDIVPVHVPLTIQTEDGEEKVEPPDFDDIPLPLFANADTLQPPGSIDSESGMRYAIKITSIDSRVAIGSVQYESSVSSNSNSSSGSGSSSLQDLANSVGTVTEPASKKRASRLTTGWQDRKKDYLSDVGSSYD